MNEESKIESVPFVFRMPDRNLYPADNHPSFEDWLFQKIKQHEILEERIYLPVFWTSYYKNNCSYGEDKGGVKILQDWLSKLDITKKYFTVVQFDNGILNDISHLDIKVFSMAGGRKDYGLPLICQPHKITFKVDKEIFCSFNGRITNPIRRTLIDLYSNKAGYFMSTQSNALPDYCRILAQSVFGLCPAGYGVNSFRIQECMEYNCIPVWISESFVPIHDLDFNDFGVLIESKDVQFIDRILNDFSASEIKTKQDNGKNVFEDYFTFESNKKLILANL